MKREVRRFAAPYIEGRFVDKKRRTVAAWGTASSPLEFGNEYQVLGDEINSINSRISSIVHEMPKGGMKGPFGKALDLLAWFLDAEEKSIEIMATQPSAQHSLQNAMRSQPPTPRYRNERGS